MAFKMKKFGFACAGALALVLAGCEKPKNEVVSF